MNLPKIYLTEAYMIDNKSILRILTQDKQINKEDPQYNHYNKLANWAGGNGRQQKLKNIDLNSIELSDRGLITRNKMITKYTTLGHVLLALKNLMDQEGHYNSESELSKLIQLTTLEILEGLSGIKNTKAPDPEPTPEPEPDPEPDPKPDKPDDTEQEPRKGRDWTAYRAQKLASGKPTSEALKEFYDEYYSIEYAGVDSPEKDTKGIVAKLKSLDKILVPEFNKLGYNPEVNPFASFLKILIKEKETGKSNIFEKLTYNTYGAIHNSFIDKKITGNMLGQKFDEKNILFCSDLYNKNGLDIVSYLDLQHQTLAAGENSEIKNLVAKIFIQQDVSGNTYNEKINNLKNLKELTLPGAPEAKLKSELEIRELYQHLFGHAAKAKETTVISEIVDKTEDTLILDMVNYLIGHYERILGDDEEESIREKLKSFNYKLDKAKTAQSEKILKDYKLKSNKTVMSLISKLLNKKREGAKNKK